MVNAIRDGVGQIVALADLWTGDGEAVELPDDYGEMPMAVRNVIEDEVVELCEIVKGTQDLADVIIATCQMAFLMGRRFGHLEYNYSAKDVAGAVPMARMGMPFNAFLRLLEGD